MAEIKQTKEKQDEWLEKTEEEKCEILESFRTDKTKNTAQFINYYGIQWSWALGHTDYLKEPTADGEAIIPRSKYAKEKNIYMDQLKYLKEVEDKTKEQKRISTYIDEKIFEEIKNIQNSDKNIFRLSFREIVEMSFRLYIERINTEEKKEVIISLK